MLGKYISWTRSCGFVVCKWTWQPWHSPSKAGASCTTIQIKISLITCEWKLVSHRWMRAKSWQDLRMAYLHSIWNARTYDYISIEYFMIWQIATMFVRFYWYSEFHFLWKGLWRIWNSYFYFTVMKREIGRKANRDSWVRNKNINCFNWKVACCISHTRTAPELFKRKRPLRLQIHIH